MRRFSLCFAFLAALLSLALSPAAPQAAIVSSPGPNPSWTEMQKFEWYVGYLARASQMCGAYDESAVLARLARMSPYGAVGLAQNRADGFLGAACVRLRKAADEMVADAAKIENYIETTYDCSDDGCFNQRTGGWESHACAAALKSHLAERAIGEDELGEITIADVRNYSTKLDYQARVRLKHCQGALYVDIKGGSCRIRKDFTRGDCAVDGVDPF